MKHQLLRNDILHFNQGGGPDLQVLEILQPNGLVRVLDPAACKDGYQELDDIRLKISQGKLQVIRVGELKATSLYKSSLLTEHCAQHAMRITREIKDLMRRYQWSACKAYEAVNASYVPEAGEPARMVSRATAYRYLKNDRCGLPLFRGDSTKGNNTPRYTRHVTEMVTDLVKQHYLQEKSPWSIVHITNNANIIGHAEGLLSVDTKISRAYVRKIVHIESHGDPEYSRLDQRTISAAKSVASYRIDVRAPFARIEQDALHLPFLVKTSSGLTNQVYLVHAIDSCTSQVVGWHFVIGSPSVADTRKCLERILFSKKEIFEDLDINTRFDLFGTPLLVVFDNGPETKGERIQNLTRLGIDLMHCRARQAQGKPFIERLNRSLKEALDVLPGCTRFSGVDGQRDPDRQGDGPIELEDLKKWVIRWYFEKWANTPLVRLGNKIFTEEKFLGHTPNERWESITVVHGNPIPLPPSLDAWRMAVYESSTVKLSRKTGVTLDTFSFRGPNLKILISRHGENQITVLSDPSDFRRVYVPDGEGEQLIELVNDCADEGTPAFTFLQAKALRKENNLSIKPSAEAEKFSRDLYKVAEQSKTVGKQNKKRKEISQDTQKLSKHNNAVERARSNPLPKLTASEPNQLIDFSQINVPLLAVRDRKSGEDRL
jgi:putative transposase